MNQYLQQLRARYEALEARERYFLLGAIFVVALTLVYLLVIEPLAQYHDRLESRIETQREEVSWMRGAVQVLRERGGPARANVQSGGSLLALTDSSARSAGLAKPLKRIQQDGTDAVRVRLEAASFDQVILWLDDLERRYGVIATEMSVDRAEGVGLVNASLTLTRAAT